MRSGRLRHKIVIESETESQDSAGEATLSFATFATVRAEIVTQPAREMLKAGQELSVQHTMFRIRYLSGITPKMRVLYDSRYFDIESATPVNDKNQVIHLLCKEIL